MTVPAVPAVPAGDAPGAAVSDDEVVGYVASYLAESGHDVPAAIDSRLTELGLDSIALVDLLLRCRTDLVAQGRVDPDAALTELPSMATVSDLRDLLRSLA